MRNIITIILSLSMYSNLSRAAEADYFTKRSQAPDMTENLDKRMNESLDLAAKQTKSCNPQELRSAIMSSLGGFGASEIERWLPQDDEVIKDPNYVYKTNGAKTKSVMGIFNFSEESDTVVACCSGLGKYNGHVISGDKLGHFLHSGYEMWFIANDKSDRTQRPTKISTIKDRKDQRHVSQTTRKQDGISPFRMKPQRERIRMEYNFDKELNRLQNLYVLTNNTENITKWWPIPSHGKGLPAVIEASQWQENTVWGARGTGVYSYGDIAANYEGYRFWNELTEGANPYFKCDGQNGSKHWKMIKKFSWNSYISDAWDEGINCSKFGNSKIQRNVDTNLAQAGLKCPIDATKCKALNDRYSGSLSAIVSPSCSGDVKKTETSTDSNRDGGVR